MLALPPPSAAAGAPWCAAADRDAARARREPPSLGPVRLVLDQEVMRQKDQGQVMMPARPEAQFTMVGAHLAFAFRETGLDRPLGRTPFALVSLAVQRSHSITAGNGGMILITGVVLTLCEIAAIDWVRIATSR